MKNTPYTKPNQAVRRGKKSGLPPGTPVFVGERKQDSIDISLISFGADTLQEIANATVTDCTRARDAQAPFWINVNGMHDVGSVQTLATLFNLHPLTTEDISNTNQRPKIEEFDDYVFFVLKMLTYNEQTHRIQNENISLILGPHYVISFQERANHLLDPIKVRLRNPKSRLRTQTTDHLIHAILDSVIDEYFVVLEKLGDHIATLDDQILSAPDKHHMKELHRLKLEMVFLRKAIWPLREKILMLEKSDSPLISNAIRPFLRDLSDHSIQIMDLVETYRDIISGLHDTFLSSMSNRMNEVIKVLTMIGTIFIPLTFIAGVYGMNFNNMPELEWQWGYYGVLGFMALLAIGMLVMFKRRKWF